MKCPYCERVMEEGIIQSPQEISWKKEFSLMGRAKFQEGSIVLSKLSILRGSKVTAYLCRSCEKIVIDYIEGRCDINQR